MKAKQLECVLHTKECSCRECKTQHSSLKPDEYCKERDWALVKIIPNLTTTDMNRVFSWQRHWSEKAKAELLDEIEKWANENIGKNADERLTLFYIGLRDKINSMRKK